MEPSRKSILKDLVKNGVTPKELCDLKICVSFAEAKRLIHSVKNESDR